MQRQQLNQYINIYLHRECRKTSFIAALFYCDCQKLNLTNGFFIFLFTVTGRGIIFICSADLDLSLCWNFIYLCIYLFVYIIYLVVYLFFYFFILIIHRQNTDRQIAKQTDKVNNNFEQIFTSKKFFP